MCIVISAIQTVAFSQEHPFLKHCTSLLTILLISIFVDDDDALI